MDSALQDAEFRKVPQRKGALSWGQEHSIVKGKEGGRCKSVRRASNRDLSRSCMIDCVRE